MKHADTRHPELHANRIGIVSTCSIVGAAVAFVISGAITAVLWVAAGALIGAFAGWALQRLVHDLRSLNEADEMAENATKAELYEKARELDVPGRSQMDRDELAKEIAHRS